MKIEYLGRGTWYITDFIKQFKNLIPLERIEEFESDCRELVNAIPQNHPRLQKNMKIKYNLTKQIETKENPFTWELIENGNIILDKKYFIK